MLKKQHHVTFFTEKQLEHPFFIAALTFIVALTVSIKEKGKTKAEVSGAEVGETEEHSEVIKIMVVARLRCKLLSSKS